MFLSGCSDDNQSQPETDTSEFEVKEVELSVTGESFGELIFELPEDVIDGEWKNLVLNNESAEVVNINVGEKLYAVKNMSDSGALSVSFDVDDHANKITYHYKLMITDSSSEKLENVEILRYRLGQCSFEFS